MLSIVEVVVEDGAHSQVVEGISTYNSRYSSRRWISFTSADPSSAWLNWHLDKIGKVGQGLDLKGAHGCQYYTASLGQTRTAWIKASLSSANWHLDEIQKGGGAVVACRGVGHIECQYSGRFQRVTRGKINWAIYTGCPKKFNNWMLLDPQCIGAITSSWHSLCLEIVFWPFLAKTKGGVPKIKIEI